MGGAGAAIGEAAGVDMARVGAVQAVDGGNLVTTGSQHASPTRGSIDDDIARDESSPLLHRVRPGSSDGGTGDCGDEAVARGVADRTRKGSASDRSITSLAAVLSLVRASIGPGALALP